MSADIINPSILVNLRAQLAESQDGVLETIAIEHGVTPLQVSECLPDHCRVAIAGDAFEEVMADLTEWGEVTFLVHSRDLILECKGRIPPGKVARGFFNLEGHGAIGGHLRYGNCASIHFVKRPFMKMDTCAITFFNAQGESMFKVYVGRDEKRQLLADQVQRFDALRDRMAAAAPKALAS